MSEKETFNNTATSAAAKNEEAASNFKPPYPNEDAVISINAAEISDQEEKIGRKNWYDGFVRLFIWYPSYLPAHEKKLLFKLDICLLTYVCASYFTKALDKSNITNAYNSGMEESIGFGGDDLAYAKSLFSAGYIVSMCFGVMFVTRPWAKYMLPILELIWGVLTFCQAAVKNKDQMFALRFLVGLAEGPVFCSVVHILGSWYKRDEVYRRVMAFSISASLGGMFSGYLQTAAYKHLNNAHGLSGWKWGFIIDGIFTCPIALLGFLVFPGAPYQIKKSLWWLSELELETARKRAVESGIAAPGPINLQTAKETLIDWKIHFFTTFWVLLNIVALPDGTALPLWLRLEPKRFSIADRNNYPTIQSAVSVVAQFFIAGLSDSYSIYPFLTFIQLLFIVAYSSLAAWNIPDGWRWVCFMIIGFDSVDQAIVSGWINRSCRHNNEKRAFVLGYSDAVSQAMNIWTNIVFFPTSHAPKFHLGFIISTCAAILMLFLPAAYPFLERLDKKRLGRAEEVSTDDSIDAVTEIIGASPTEKISN